MLSDYCYGSLCFFPLDANAPRIFGFSEFLTALALMVLAWTIADARYRFRVNTAPIPLQGITFSVIGAVGILTLLTDLWRAEEWLVPRGGILTSSSWQAILGGIFLLTFLTWSWFAFIRPPIFGKRNALRYAQALYRSILKGSAAEMAVTADEFTRSVKNLIGYATDRGELKNFKRDVDKDTLPHKKLQAETAIANEILLLIADRRFCRAIVASSPGTAYAIFTEIGKTRKFGVQIEVFAKNVVNEALGNKDSFLFHEADGYDSGLIGYQKPLSQAMFANYKMVEVIGTLFDPDLDEMRQWDAAQWSAYCRIALITLKNYAENLSAGHSFVLYRAKSNIEHAASDLYKLNGMDKISWTDDVLARLRVVVNFIKDAIKILDETCEAVRIPLRVRADSKRETIFDGLANTILEVVFLASKVRSPARQCWWIQHNSVWSELFNFHSVNGPAAKIIKFKVRRLIYNEVADMKRFPNFKGATILGFCLNVMGAND